MKITLSKLISISLGILIIISIISLLIFNFNSVDCSKQMNISEVKNVFDINKESVDKIKNISSNIDIIVSEGIKDDSGKTQCEGKADIVIYYDTLDNLNKIKEMIGDKFYNVSYRTKNI